MMRRWIIFLLIQTAMSEVVAPLAVPEVIDATPAAGRRVRIIPPEYEGTDVYYALYLPENYAPGGSYPVIVEYTGNQWRPGGSTGKVRGANLGYAPAKALGAIWVVMPYVDGTNSVTTWWGNEEQTVEYCLKNIRRVCMTYGGNSAEIFICGFSRGAIAVNYIGLYNDAIADVWIGFFSHDHYDGQREWKGTYWGSPLESYREQAGMRILRLAGRAVLISQKDDVTALKEYIRESGYSSFGKFSFVEPVVDRIIPGIPVAEVPSPHTDKWMLYPSDEAATVFRWFAEIRKKKPGTYSVSGVVTGPDGRPAQGVIVDSGRTHFAVSASDGSYIIEGLTAGCRTIGISKENRNFHGGILKNIDLNEAQVDVDFQLIDLP